MDLYTLLYLIIQAVSTITVLEKNVRSFAKSMKVINPWGIANLTPYAYALDH